MKEKPTLLYAPTWHSRQCAGAFFDECSELITELSQHFNLLVKLHPFLEEDFPAHVFHLCSKEAKRATFLNDFPAIYPLLALADLYLGDLSSITYDFLAFDKPLFFLHKGAKEYAHRCGVVIPPSKRGKSGDLILSKLEKSQEMFKEKRRESYLYAFGKERSADEIKGEIYSFFTDSSGGRTTTELSSLKFPAVGSASSS
jgi:CDP-glycerol glycerophosphotransferase (TagB/SpsB family)